jgi:hypothetical protein
MQDRGAIVEAQIGKAGRSTWGIVSGPDGLPKPLVPFRECVGGQ